MPRESNWWPKRGIVPKGMTSVSDLFSVVKLVTYETSRTKLLNFQSLNQGQSKDHSSGGKIISILAIFSMRVCNHRLNRKVSKNLHSRIAGVNDVQPFKAEYNVSRVILPARCIVGSSMPLQPALRQDRPPIDVFVSCQAQCREDPAHSTRRGVILLVERSASRCSRFLGLHAIHRT